MAIALRSTGTFFERAAENPSAVPYPATVVAGDLLVLMGSVNNVGLVTNPAGWTQVASFSATGNTLAPDIFVAIKIAAGTEGGGTVSVTHNSNVSAWQILGFSGVDNTTPQDVAATTWDNTGDPVLPSQTIATTGACQVYAAANLNTGNTATPPSGFTETGDLSTGTRTFTVGYKLGLSAGASGTVTVDFTGTGRSIGVLIALRPAASSYTLAHIVETDTAWAVTGRKTDTLDHIVETDTAWAPTWTSTPPAPAGWPSLLVECAFATVPSSLTPTWTDITAYVRMDPGLGMSHGRPDRYATTQPGMMSLTLNNTDGRFTAGNTTSPYYPNVKIGRRIRVSYTFNSILYRLFDGYVNEWPTEWPSGGGYAWAPITATDRFKKLARARKLGSAVREETLAAGPVGYWPLGEPDGSTSAADASGSQAAPLAVAQAGAGGTLTFGSGVGPPTDGMTAAMLTRAGTYAGQYLQSAPMSLPVTGGVVSLSCWFVATDLGGTLIEATCAGATPTCAARLGIGGGPNDQLQAQGIRASVGGALASAGTVVNNGLHHGVAVVAWTTTDITITLYLDGQLEGSTVSGTAGTVPTAVTSVTVGALIFRDPYLVSDLYTGTVSQPAVYGRALTAGEVTAIYQAGISAFAGETPDARVTRVGRYIGLTDSSLFALDACSSLMAAWPPEGGAPLDLMQEAAAAEDGQLFMGGNGKITLHSRTRRFALTSAFTLHGTHAGVRPVFAADDQLMVNDASYSRTGGTPQRAVNTASVAEYDTYSDEQTYALSTDNAALDRANWRVNTTSTPSPRCSQVRVDLMAQTDLALVAALVNADVSTRFTFDQLPTQAPASSVDLVIEGEAERLSSQGWERTFNTTPATTNKVFVLNSSLLNGPDILGY